MQEHDAGEGILLGTKDEIFMCTLQLKGLR
jgi:hypothetical protein